MLKLINLGMISKAKVHIVTINYSWNPPIIIFRMTDPQLTFTSKSFFFSKCTHSDLCYVGMIIIIHPFDVHIKRMNIIHSRPEICLYTIYVRKVVSEKAEKFSPKKLKFSPRYILVKHRCGTYLIIS